MAMITVNGVGLSPSVFKCTLQDISTSESGRTQDGLMHKDVVAVKRKIDLGFNGSDPAMAKKILQCFKPTYVNVAYPDPESGLIETRTFYTGDKSADVKIWAVGNKRYSSIAFNIIER